MSLFKKTHLKIEIRSSDIHEVSDQNCVSRHLGLSGSIAVVHCMNGPFSKQFFGNENVAAGVRFSITF